VEDIKILDVFAAAITGNVDSIKSSTTFFGISSNSSISQTEMDFPEIEDEEVEAAIILQPFSNSIECLFHSLTPGFIHIGKCLYIPFILSKISFVVDCLFANIATSLFILNKTKNNMKAAELVVL
jgi:hypothetical protein